MLSSLNLIASRAKRELAVKALLISISSFILAGCGSLTGVVGHLVRSTKSTGSLSGRIYGLSTDASAGISSMNSTLSCSEPVANLYQVDAQGVVTGEGLSSSEIAADGTYAFTKASEFKEYLNSQKDKVSRLSIVVEGCDVPISRLVTGLTSQDVSAGASIVSYLDGTLTAVDSLNAASLSSLYGSLLNASDQAAAFSLLNSDTQLASRFEQLFGISPTVLNATPPKLLRADVPASVNEMSALSLSANVNHWSSTYERAAEWEEVDLQSTLIGLGLNATWTPGKNKQGSRTLVLTLGKDDGAGRVDRSAPYRQKTFIVAVSDSFPATAPSLSVVSSQVSGSQSVTLQIDTGSGMGNCASFSKLALTENDVLPPAFVESNTFGCTTAGSQSLIHLTSPGDGIKVFRLWAMDSAGRVSVLASSASMTLDQTTPQVQLTSLNSGMIKGGADAVITWTASDANFGSAPYSVEYTADGGTTWVAVAGPINATSYTWSVPLIHSSQVKVRVIATDSAGNQSAVSSASSLLIDSTAPAAPPVSLTSLALTNDATAKFEVSDCSDIARVFVNESLTAPLSSANGWIDCVANSEFQHTVSGNGTHNLRLWSQDAVGNVSTTSSVLTMVLDQTPPAVTLNSSMAGLNLSGNALQAPAINSYSLSFSASDSLSGIKSPGFVVEVCAANCGSPASWIVSQSGLSYTATPQGFTWTVPALNSSTVQLRIKGSDNAGNFGVSAASASFTIDSAAPVPVSTVINDGAPFAGTAVLQIKSDLTDNLTGAADLKLRMALANAATESCQSEFVDANWVAFPGAMSPMTQAIPPIDGVKKICIWAKDLAGNISVISPSAGTTG